MTTLIKHQILNLPIFPLPVFLLPEGITRLRIFEVRYLKMIRVASQGNGFVIFFNNGATQLEHLQWGSWVEIINFDQGDDGILEVDVKCKSLVEIKSIDKDNDNLHHGDVTYLEHWSKSKVDSYTDTLSTSLKEIFENTPLLAELYVQVPSDDPNWVISRWLELLPSEEVDKKNFINKHSFQQAKDLIQSIIINN